INGSTTTPSSFTNAITFNNTNGVTLGNNVANVFNFNGGLTSLNNTTTINGTINAVGNAVSLGTLALAGNSAISAGTIALNAVSGAHSLSLTSTAGSTLSGIINIASLTLGGGS